ncbi:DUF4360 domain-containing protein [Pilimelia terevasa]|uniref:DUF4360 domain-containing protein n=1 Tax=Pilimelia terevasa TaxID=53372 RepID=UPI0016695F70|nr:DUF4360 domain-containing protein [Pilimelia terevasa]
MLAALLASETGVGRAAQAAGAEPVVTMQVAEVSGSGCDRGNTTISTLPDRTEVVVGFSALSIRPASRWRTLDCAVRGSISVPAGYRATFVFFNAAAGYAAGSATLRQTRTFAAAPPTAGTRIFGPTFDDIFRVHNSDTPGGLIPCGGTIPFVNKIDLAAEAGATLSVDSFDIATSPDTVVLTKC